MLLRNDLLQYVGEHARMLRILWIDSANTLAYTYELGLAGACPRPVQLAALVADVREGRARLLPRALWRPEVDPATLPPKYLALRASAWAIVSELVRNEPALFDAHSRGRLIAACSAAHGVSHPTIYRYLRRYWERGQYPDALLPDYANSGAAGKTRRANPGVKRGRPGKSGAIGLNVDAAVRETIRSATMRYVATHDAFSRRDAYRQMIVDYFGADQEAAPSYGQFTYWLDRDGALAAPG